jgi:hypothetical protein
VPASTVTKGRLSVVPGAAIVVETSHAPAPRGSRQNCSEVMLLSGPYQAMYAVPAPSTATPGLCPVPMVSGVAAPAPAGATSVAATHARTRAVIRTGFVTNERATRACYAGHHSDATVAPTSAAPKRSRATDRSPCRTEALATSTVSASVAAAHAPAAATDCARRPRQTSAAITVASTNAATPSHTMTGHCQASEKRAQPQRRRARVGVLPAALEAALDAREEPREPSEPERVPHGRHGQPPRPASEPDRHPGNSTSRPRQRTRPIV